jgi:hypothetical protein
MFTPEELEAIPVHLEQLFRDLQLNVMTDIVEQLRINTKEIIPSTDYKMNRLYELGLSKRKIKKLIKNNLSLDSQEINHLYKDVLRKGYARDDSLYKYKGKVRTSFEDNKPLQQLISAIKNQTNDECKNITQSMGFAVKQPDGKLKFKPIADYYQQTLDNAEMQILNGTSDYNTVLKQTVKEMTNSGLRTIDYASGYSSRVDVAARRALMTGFHQVVGKINEENAEQLDTDYFEITYHQGARPSHQVWQGRVYSKEELKTVCGYGEVTGLKGANCRHDFHPFIKGVSKRIYTDEELDRMNAKENTPREYNGKSYTTYEATQKQRRLETAMRAQRQEIKLLQEGGADEDTILAAKARYNKLQNEYVNFSKSMNLPQEWDRVNVDSMGNIGNINNKTVENSAESGIIQVRGGEMYRKSSKDKIEPMPKKQFHRIEKSFKKQGGIFQYDEATDTYLKSKNAEAITYNAKTVLLKKNPSRASVFEELIHTQQYKSGKNDGSYLSRLNCEIEAQKKLLKHSKAYKLTEPEFYQTQKALKAYEEELATYIKKGGK